MTLTWLLSRTRDGSHSGWPPRAACGLPWTAAALGTPTRDNVTSMTSGLTPGMRTEAGTWSTSGDRVQPRSSSQVELTGSQGGRQCKVFFWPVTTSILLALSREKRTEFYQDGLFKEGPDLPLEFSAVRSSTCMYQRYLECFLSKRNAFFTSTSTCRLA